MMLQYSQLTNIGSRAVNEDFAGCFENGSARCFVVCDGLGGHGMGDAASQLVVGSFGLQFAGIGSSSDFGTKPDPDVIDNDESGIAETDAAKSASTESSGFCSECCGSLEGFLEKAFTAAQEKLLAEQLLQHASSKMKTTAVVLVADENNACIGHVGDSRAYVFRRGKVLIRTLDHSIPQMLVLSRQLKESQIRNHPDRNLVLRVMGIEWEEPMFELMDPIPLKKCQAFLLCTDGFWERIDEKDMCSLLRKASSPEDWLHQMADVIKKNGEGREMDNYTAIAVWNT